MLHFDDLCAIWKIIKLLPPQSLYGFFKIFLDLARNQLERRRQLVGLDGQFGIDNDRGVNPFERGARFLFSFNAFTQATGKITQAARVDTIGLIQFTAAISRHQLVIGESQQ